MNGSGNGKNGKSKFNKWIFLAALIVLLLGVSGYALRGYVSGALWGRPDGGGEPAVETDAAYGTAGPDEPAAGSGGQNAEVRNGESGGVQAGEKPEGTPFSASGLPNTRHGWGLKRNSSHRQPEMPSSITATLEKYGAYWIGSPGGKDLYLTFDEGYENGYTPKILDILKANGVRAAFFVTGHYVKSQPDLVRRMVDEGHIVGNHTDTHPSLPDVSDAQIERELRAVEQEFEKVTGRKGMKYLRPPQGEYSERTLAVTRNLGYHNIFWSLAMVDWVPMPGGPQEAYDSVMGNLHNGALILLHAVSKDNTEALDRILKDARARGYTFKTLDDLVAGF
ncbi:MAG TPA: delta-lactam-biosynthetic de-N-acetylase [Bacillota bacterium]|nr:delta-lactam-biosynthetic de-N-acetylase [Bacillota bacterium]